MTGEQKNFQRLAHGSGKKLAMEKEADQMRRIAPRHRKERTPCPCCMAGVKGIFQLFASRPGTGSAEVRQIIPADAFGSRENSAQAGSTAGRIFRQKVSPRRKAPRTRQEKENFHRGAVLALLFAASLSARACAHTTGSQRPPGRNTNRSTQAGPRYTESRYRPFPQRNMFRPAPSAVHVPSSHGKTPSPIPRREGCGIFSLPAGKRTKKSPAGGRSAP